MRDPFKLTGPTCLSFSGGSTSAYMLWRVLQANTAEDIARWLVIVFANTGREDEATLRFVRDCGAAWNVPIVWLEYQNDAPGYCVVGFDRAARDGGPFEALIRKRNYLPNPVTRFCTVELKIRVMAKWLKAQGLLDGGIDMMVGIRADEPRRVAKMRHGKNSESAQIENCIPLADAGVTVQEVDAFWLLQGFRLELTRFKGRTLAGNCDLCFLKPPAQRLSLVQERPVRGVWWARMEREGVASATGDGARFTKDGPSYAMLQAFAADQRDMFDPEEEAIACFCGD